MNQLARSWPPSSSSTWLNHILHVYLQACTSTASKFTQSRPSNGSPNSLNHILQGISELARLWPLSSHDLGLHVQISKLAQSQPPSTSPRLLDHDLRVHRQVHSISASMCILKVAQLWPLSLHNHGLQVHGQRRPITASECISEFTQSWPPQYSPNTLHNGLQVHLHTSSITTLERVYQFTQSRWSETVEWDGRQRIITTPPYLP